MNQREMIIGDLSGDIAASKKAKPAATVKVKKTSARKAAKQIRHPKAPFSLRSNVLPPLVGITMMVSILGAMNSQWIAAQLHYRFAPTPSTSSIIEPPVTTVAATSQAPAPDLSAPSKITVPSIKVEAPVVFEPSQEESKVQIALRSGVVHFGSTANPGQPGNVVLFGHSSGQPWAPGDYKFVFTLLDKLKPRDKIFVDYQGTRYTYQITNSEVVLPTNVSVLNTTDKHTLTLITCTPVGTNQKRLVVRAEQIIPRSITAVTAATAAPMPASSAQPIQPAQLPNGDATSFWQTIRNLF